MTCEEFEQQLSDYIEQTLDRERRAGAEHHMAACAVCHGLMDEVMAAIDICRNFPEFEPDAALVQRILQSTTGKKAPRSPFRISFKSIFRPSLFPKYAIGAVLTFCFISFVINLLGSSNGGSQTSVIRKADVFVHQLYSRGLRVYDKTAQWQVELKTLTDRLGTQIKYHIGQMGEQLKPEPGEQKPKEEPKDDKEKKSSIEPAVFARRNEPYDQTMGGTLAAYAYCKTSRPCAIRLVL